MPRNNHIEKICVIGAGPIVIGQGCEFDYSGTQACKALEADGYEVVLINSNPATIMTDPGIASRTYIEPLTVDVISEILKKERPDALLPTLGGQTALNLALELWDAGVLDRLGIQVLGARPDAIRLAEDRDAFKRLMLELGLDVARSGRARSLADAYAIVEDTGLPCVLRPSFTLGGVGGGIVERADELEDAVQWALEMSPVGEVLIEESLIGWKEYEMEVMRDHKDRAVVVCSIENLDPMGVHTGDSITVAPAQTLTDREYQRMRNASLAILRAIGVETGGSNIQFAVDPQTGRMIVIEMNPRVSRSSALASKATGFPIAKIAALLAVGYTLDEIKNSITKETPACFEPALDYVVTKIPRFDFARFPHANETLTTQMKSVGEVMAIGRTFAASLNKALRCLEDGPGDLLPDAELLDAPIDTLRQAMRRPTANRLSAVATALWRGLSVEEVAAVSRIDPWFVGEIAEIVELLANIRVSLALTNDLLRLAKQAGIADETIASLRSGLTPEAVRAQRLELGLTPTFKRVDTCAAEFVAHTPYLYATYDEECEANVDGKPRVLILGSGPNRIGQGIEFDYCCVKAAQAVRDAGYVAIMLNCNPETVSTDHDTSDRLYFEPIDLEAVLDVVALENPVGVILQFGGQTPLRLASALAAAGVPIVGTHPDVIERAEDRERFATFASGLGFAIPAFRSAFCTASAYAAADELGFPLMVRPSHVLGGRAMAVIHSAAQLDEYLSEVFDDDGEPHDPRCLPLLLDQFLEGALELDVDVISDGSSATVGGVMEQVERAGVHSGDSACLLPGPSIGRELDSAIRQLCTSVALELGVVGLCNLQLAVVDEELYLLEVNPRGSRTVPFVSKATGVCLTTAATRVMLGTPLGETRAYADLTPDRFYCKEVVLPLSRFPGTPPQLGPTMKSTGEVMASGSSAAQAYARAQLAAGNAPAGSDSVLLDATQTGLKDLRPYVSDVALLFARDEPTAMALADTLGRHVTVWTGQPIDLALLLSHETPEHLFHRVLASATAWFTTPEAFRLWAAGTRESVQDDVGDESPALQVPIAASAQTVRRS